MSTDWDDQVPTLKEMEKEYYQAKAKGMSDKIAPVYRVKTRSEAEQEKKDKKKK